VRGRCSLAHVCSEEVFSSSKPLSHAVQAEPPISGHKTAAGAAAAVTGTRQDRHAHSTVVVRHAHSTVVRHAHSTVVVRHAHSTVVVRHAHSGQHNGQAWA
jgi:hypothetical protein